MIDFQTEELQSFETALIPGDPHLGTRYRWTLKGVRGAKLESILIGNRRFTSTEAIGRFITALNSPKSSTPPATKTRRAKQNSAARAALAEAGI